MASRDPKIVLDLHGSRAARGVELDALEEFIEQFRRALREFARSQRGEMAARGGHPDAQDAAATAFRLVKFRTGSGVATLEPVPLADDPDGESVLGLGDVESRASLTLRGLLDAVEGEEAVEPPVVEALASARKAIGPDGHFGIKRAGEKQRTVIDEARIEGLRRRNEDLAEEDRWLSVTGRLHFIEVDFPQRRVGVRAPDGTDWVCSYDETIKALVTTLIEKLVTVEGEGRKVSPKGGRLTVSRIEALPEYPQDELFTDEPVPLAQLRSTQGVEAPQGLAALIDPEWVDDEAGQSYLEATLHDVSG